jgi:hypothetical protein
MACSALTVVSAARASRTSDSTAPLATPFRRRSRSRIADFSPRALRARRFAPFPEKSSDAKGPTGTRQIERDARMPPSLRAKRSNLNYQ